MSDEQSGSTTRELSSEEKRANVIRLAFGGSEELFNQFVDLVRRRFRPALVSCCGAAPSQANAGRTVHRLTAMAPERATST